MDGPANKMSIKQRVQGPWQSKNFVRRFLKLASSFVSHSQIMIEFQPSVFRASMLFLSRSRFRASFGTQYSKFDLGVCANLQP